jgi:hypothetical protein
MPILKHLALILGLLIAIGNVMPVKPQISSPIVISYAISGQFLFDSSNALISLNTYDGSLQNLVVQPPPLLPISPFIEAEWSPTGRQAAYINILDIAVLQLLSSPQILFNRASIEGILTPHSWSPDEQSLLVSFESLDAVTKYYLLETLHISSQQRVTLRQFEVGDVILDQPDQEFLAIESAGWNQRFPDWVVYSIQTLSVASRGNEERIGRTLTFAYNLTTSSSILVNNLTNNPVYSIPDNAWSPDGRSLILETGQLGITNEVLTILDEQGNWLPQPSKAIDGRERDTLIAWIGVEDLLLTRSYDESTAENIYYLVQIGTQYHEREAFRIYLPEFHSGRGLPNIGTGSWHLTANPDERAVLSCLFDQSLPAQFVANQNVLIESANDTPIRIHESPSQTSLIQSEVDGTVLVQLGTYSYCADGYRWWQVTTLDGVTGWITEADAQRYYVQPETPTPTPSPTPTPTLSPTSTATPTATPTPDSDVPVILTSGSFRALQNPGDRRVYIERAMSAGIDPFDSPPSDGWTLIGRTNGAGDNGTLRAFTVINGVPYAAVQHATKGCIVITPSSLAARTQGQTRLVRIVAQQTAYCGGDWTGFAGG